ncbi:MAG: hypothetical protein ACR2H5_04405 [Ktedonobacteraceae bacterium]
MPKKSAAVRTGAQRNKPKVQKSFELVRPASNDRVEPETVASDALVTVADVSAIEEEGTKPQALKQSVAKSRAITSSASSAVSTTKVPEAVSPTPEVSTPPKGSAAARLVARRQANQKAQQRAAASLITAEHFVYVRKDLRFIAILAIIMFAAIIILHFVPGIGS